MKKTKDENNKNCELIFILDRSGSMGGLEEETIKGYNSVVKKQIEECENLKVTTVLFDNQIDKIYDGVSGKDAMLNDTKIQVKNMIIPKQKNLYKQNKKTVGNSCLWQLTLMKNLSAEKWV